MKKNTLNLIACFALMLCSSAIFAQLSYCLPQSANHCSVGDYINNFSTTGGITNITNNNSGCSGPSGYQFISNQSVTVNRGATFNFSVQSGPTFGQGFRIWIDYNQDGDFVDVGENVWNSVTSSTAVVNSSITVPATANTGSTRMRVRSNYNSVPTDPCAAQTYSEVEDYVININQQVAYCVATYASACTSGDFINNFSTTGGSTNITNNNTGCGVGNLNQTVTCLQGASFNVSMQAGSSWSQGFGIWIDYNQDGDYLDVGELVYQSPNASTAVFTGSVTVPATAAVGITRMRVRCAYATVPTDPCSSYSFGEAEDYFIYIPGPQNPTGASGSPAAVCVGGSTTLTATGVVGTATWYTGSCGGTMIGTGNTLAVTPSATTTYYVRNINGQYTSNGCATVTVTVNPLPTVTATAAAGTICDGNSETLTANGAATYSWSSGGTAATETVTPNTTTTYTVTGTDANGCVNSATVTVNVNALPVVTASAMASTICDGNSDTLMASGADTYVWSSGGTAAMEVVAPSTTTTYTVTGTDLNGCSNTATATVNVNALPTVTASAMMSTICDGGSDTLMAAGADTYVWNTGGTAATEVVAPNTTTSYTVTGTDVNGCSNTATVTVNVNALPTVALGADTTQCAGTVTLDAQNAGASYLWSDSSAAQTLTVAASGTYSVMVTDTNGCMNSDSINVTINSNPTVALGADSTQCGGTITLDAQNAGASYMWNDSTTAQTLTVSASGTYYVSVVDGNGCEGSDTVNVTINTPPTVTGTASASTVCVDDADVTLTGAPAGGSWAGPGVSGTNFDPSVGAGAQTLTYSFTDNNGCSGTATVTVTVDACVGVAENTLADGVNVYPNPNNGVFTLAINANVGDVVIEMVDMQGRVVYAANENNVQAGFTKQISLETQASGLYIIRLTSATEQHTLRVNVQK